MAKAMQNARNAVVSFAGLYKELALSASTLFTRR